MPILNKPALALSFSLEDTLQLIEDTIKAKYWHNFEIADIKLIYVPYWLFSYDAYSENVDEETKAASTQELGSGKIGLNAISNELDENVASLYEGASLEETLSLGKEKYPVEIQRPRIRDAEAKRIIPLKVAAMLGTTKGNIIISGLEMIYVPMWISFVTVAEGNFRLEINAVTGELTHDEEVPYREKGWLEVTGETIEDLKRPGAWIDYTASAGSGIIALITNNALVYRLKQDTRLQIAVLIILAILIGLWTFGFL